MMRMLMCLGLLTVAAGAEMQDPPMPSSEAALQPIPVVEGKPTPEKAPCKPCAPTSSKCPTLEDACVCAVWPAYINEEAGTVLYYSEICSPSTECEINDVAYYWDSSVTWPVECKQDGIPGKCDDCKSVDKADPSKPFIGCNNYVSAGQYIEDILPKRHPNFPNADLSRGVLAGFNKMPIVRFKLSREPVYARLFIVKVNGSVINSNSTKDRVMFLGFETEVTPTEQKQAIDVRSENAKRRLEGGGFATDNINVQKVSYGGAKFLVLLKKSANP